MSEDPSATKAPMVGDLRGTAVHAYNGDLYVIDGAFEHIILIAVHRGGAAVRLVLDADAVNALASALTATHAVFGRKWDQSILRTAAPGFY